MDRAYNEFELSILANVEKYGWHAMHVFDPDGNNEPFTYSIGFSRTLKAPEFIVFGLPQKLMHNMLWEVFRQIESGSDVEDGQLWHGLIDGFDCVGRLATHEATFREYATSANWFWKQQGREGQPDLVQLIWPGSRDGLFPWDVGCSKDVISAQPRLWT